MAHRFLHLSDSRGVGSGAKCFAQLSLYFHELNCCSLPKHIDLSNQSTCWECLLVQPLDGRERGRPLLFDIPCGFDVLRLSPRLGRPLVDVLVAGALDFRSCDSADEGGVGACASLTVLWRGSLTLLDGATTAALNRSSLSAILAPRRLGIWFSLAAKS